MNMLVKGMASEIKKFLGKRIEILQKNITRVVVTIKQWVVNA